MSLRDGCANPDHTVHARDLAVVCYAFFVEGSALAGDDDLFARIGAAIAFERRWQRPTRLIDLISVNLRLRTSGGLDRVTFQIKCCFAGPGEWETGDQVGQVLNGQTAILKSGHGIFRRGEGAISIGPGAAAHWMWQMRGTASEPESFRMLIALQTPVDHTLEIRYGQWSPVTGDILAARPIGM